MSCTPYVLFGSLGAILINVGFITLITWGASTYWPIGFVLCVGYTVVLFTTGRRLEDSTVRQYESVRGNESDQEEIPFHSGPVTEGSEPNSHTNDVQTSTTITTTKLPLTVSILYGLGVVSLGVCGSIFSTNMVPQCNDPSSSWHPKHEWVTNISSLPKGAVQKWAVSSSDGPYRSYAYVESTNTTMFAGFDAGSFEFSQCLFTVNVTAPPQKHRDFKLPERFTVVNNETVCFTSLISDNFLRVLCSDGTGFRSIVSPKAPLYEPNSDLFDLYAWNDTLWFKQVPPYNSASGYLVVSLIVKTMEYSLHSTFEEAHRETECTNATFKQYLVSLFTVAIPTTLVSLALWKAKSPPTMAITTFCGLSLIFTCICVMVDPNNYAGETPWQWWFCLFGAAWLVVSTYLNLTRKISLATAPLDWGFVVATLGFAYGAVSLLPMDNDDLLAWLLLNISVVFPILLFGMANSSMTLIFLGSLGFLADAARISQFVKYDILSFVVFSVSGLVVGWIGFKLTTYQYVVQNFAAGMVRKIDEALFGYVLPDQQSMADRVEAPVSRDVDETAGTDDSESDDAIENPFGEQVANP